MKPYQFYLLLALPLLVLALTQIVTLQQTPLAGEWLYPLLAANVALIVLMLAGIVWAAARLWRRWRLGAAGSRLASRLAGLFLTMALLPATGLYVISASSIFRGIESWFSTPLGHAFEEGLAFGQSVLGREFEGLEKDAHNLARAIDSGRSLPFWRDDLQLLYQVEELIIYNREGVPIAAASGETADNLSELALNAVRRNQAYRNVSEGARRNLEVVLRLSQQRSGYALKVSRPLPAGIAAGLDEVERGRQAYQNLLIVRRGLLLSFMATLTLAFVIVLAVSLWASARLGLHLFRPLTRMAAAATAVGRGDFNHRLPVGEVDDEIAQLGRAFNSMVGDLRQSRREISERQAALAESNAYLENLLASLTTGVLAVDAAGRLARFNHNAEQMLRTPLAHLMGKHFSKWTPLPQIAPLVRDIMSAADTGGKEQRLSGASGCMLVARLRRLSHGGGVLVMVDDISKQIEVEREAVWEEASRRFAHEIKNPLTPIQLAADRLQSKLADKLAGDDKQLLSRLSSTITNQVEAMREMVDAFRMYADKQRRRKTMVDLNDIAAEVIHLYERPPLRLQLRKDESLPPINGDAVLLRQALHNLMTNATDAVAGVAEPKIIVQVARREDKALLTVEDNGGGVADEMRGKVFNPYQTDKAHGTGLGLVIVRKIMEEHGGEAYLENVNDGTRATLIFLL